MADAVSLDRWTALVREAGLRGWLVADFRRNSPVLARLLGLGNGILTRRCFLWLPAPGHGEPMAIISQVDAHTFSDLTCTVTTYAGFEDMSALLRRILPTGGQVAMEYVENGVLPTVSRVDGGLLDLVRSFGVNVVSSGSLIASMEVWNEEQRGLHRQAAKVVDDARRFALDRCRAALRDEESLTEGALAQVITRFFAEHGMEAPDGPDVAVNAHAADPHYGVDGPGGSVIEPDAVLLIDLWCRVRDRAGAPFADSTWMAYTGSHPPLDLVRTFDAVKRARDAAINTIDHAAREGTRIEGWEVDRVARLSLTESGFEDALMHRTGHSLGTDHVHGMGTNLDAVEFPDNRPLIPWSGFTIEPGAYRPGRFGVRLEVSAMLADDAVEVTTERQDELTILTV